MNVGNSNNVDTLSNNSSISNSNPVFNNNNGLVLVASQNANGSLVLNRISAPPLIGQGPSQHSGSQMVAPGAPPNCSWAPPGSIPSPVSSVPQAEQYTIDLSSSSTSFNQTEIKPNSMTQFPHTVSSTPTTVVNHPNGAPLHSQMVDFHQQQQQQQQPVLSEQNQPESHIPNFLMTDLHKNFSPFKPETHVAYATHTNIGMPPELVVSQTMASSSTAPSFIDSFDKNMGSDQSFTFSSSTTTTCITTCSSNSSLGTHVHNSPSQLISSSSSHLDMMAGPSHSQAMVSQ